MRMRLNEIKLYKNKVRNIELPTHPSFELYFCEQYFCNFAIEFCDYEHLNNRRSIEKKNLWYIYNFFL